MESILIYRFFSLRRNWIIPSVDKIVAKKFGPGLPSVGDIEKRTALVLINTNPAMDYVAPLPENVIPVAGLHIKETKPIPKVKFSVWTRDFFPIFLNQFRISLSFSSRISKIL